MISLKLRKIKDKIRDVEWRRASVYYESKYKLLIQRIKYDHKKDLEDLNDHLTQMGQAEIDKLKAEISEMDAKMQKIKHEYKIFETTKYEMLLTRQQLMPALDGLHRDVSEIFKLFMSKLDKIDYLSARSDKKILKMRNIGERV